MSNFSYRNDTKFQQVTLHPEAKRDGNRTDDPLAELERLRAKTVAKAFGHRGATPTKPFRSKLNRRPAT